MDRKSYIDRLYISDPRVWATKDIYILKRKSKRGRRVKKVPEKLEIDKTLKTLNQRFSPEEAAEERAKSVLDTAREEGRPHMPLKRKIEDNDLGPPGKRVRM
jgi:hypothetical protein